MERREDLIWTAVGLFIAGGLLLGMGIGFALDNLVAGLFAGRGGGMVAAAATAGVGAQRRL